MTFTVVWRLSATAELAAVTSAADDPATVQQAAARVDFRLRRMARDLGESRGPASDCGTKTYSARSTESTKTT